MGSPRNRSAGVALLEARLDAFREYAEVVKAQAEAVDAGDMDEATRLGGLRELLQDRLDSGGELATDAEPAPPGSTEEEALERRSHMQVILGGEEERSRAAELQAETFRVLLDAAREHERMTRSLERLRAENEDEVDEVGRSRSGVRSYLRGPARRDGLDIRF